MTRLRSRTWKQAYEDAPGNVSHGPGSRGERGVGLEAAMLALLTPHLAVVMEKLAGDGCSLTWIRDRTGVPTSQARVWLESLGGHASHGNRWIITSLERTLRANKAISRLRSAKPSRHRPA